MSSKIHELVRTTHQSSQQLQNAQPISFGRLYSHIEQSILDVAPARISSTKAALSVGHNDQSTLLKGILSVQAAFDRKKTEIKQVTIPSHKSNLDTAPAKASSPAKKDVDVKQMSLRVKTDSSNRTIHEIAHDRVESAVAQSTIDPDQPMVFEDLVEDDSKAKKEDEIYRSIGLDPTLFKDATGHDALPEGKRKIFNTDPATTDLYFRTVKDQKKQEKDWQIN